MAPAAAAPGGAGAAEGRGERQGRGVARRTPQVVAAGRASRRQVTGVDAPLQEGDALVHAVGRELELGRVVEVVLRLAVEVVRVLQAHGVVGAVVVVVAEGVVRPRGERRRRGRRGVVLRDQRKSVKNLLTKYIICNVTSQRKQRNR